MEWYVYPLAILAGIVAGIINTLAGSGSLVTLPMLVFLGLPSNVANATNRIGVVMQNIVGITTFQRSGKLDLRSSWWPVLASVPGGILGAWAAAQLKPAEMDLVIGIVMVLMLGVILFQPTKWLREHSDVRPGRPRIGILLLFAVVGFYGGFIQAGVGVFLLAAMVLGLNYSLAHANAVKLMIVLIVTVAAVIVFMIESAGANQNLIHWGFGLLMAVGQSIGAWMAARFATRSKHANIWTRRLLIAVIIISIIRFFGIWDWLVTLF